MKNFNRAVRLALRQWRTLVGAVACSLTVAVLWGANIGTIYPFIEVVLQGESMHKWIDARIDEAQGAAARLERQVDQHRRDLEKELDPQKRQRVGQELALAKARLAAEKKALSLYRTAAPWIRSYLPADAFRTLICVAAILFAGAMLRNLFMMGNGYLVTRITERTKLELRKRAYRHILDMDNASFSEKGASPMMSRLTHDVEALGFGLRMLFGESIREPLKIVVCVAGAAMISWRLLALSLIFTPLVLVLMGLLSKALKRANRHALEETSNLYGQLSQSFQGIQIVKAYTMEEAETRRFTRMAQRIYRRMMKLTVYDSFTKPLNELLGIGVISLALLAGGYLALNQQTHLWGIRMTDRPLSFGAMMAFFAFLAGVSDPARKLSRVFVHLQQGAAGADRVYEMLDAKPSISDPPMPKRAAKRWRELHLDNINFHYTPDSPVLRDIDLRLSSQETLALVGPNGCGKSSLVNLILRFYDPHQGVVRLDGLDVREMSLHDLRSRIGLVTQQPTLFDDTIAANLRYGSPDATDEQVEQAARRAHAHEFIVQSHRGYNTMIGEGGQRLSGGQRQRIALARAMLRDPSILILDEATSQIDPESEHLIHDALAQFTRGRLAIMITHRMSTLRLADRIVVMDDGRIADLGAHDELLARCPLYRRLQHSDLRMTG